MGVPGGRGTAVVLEDVESVTSNNIFWGREKEPNKTWFMGKGGSALTQNHL